MQKNLRENIINLHSLLKENAKICLMNELWIFLVYVLNITVCKFVTPTFDTCDTSEAATPSFQRS